MPEPVDPFVRFVSSVEGRLVSRWDAPGSSFGARVATLEERKTGAPMLTWDTACVVPLTAEFCAKYDRELRNAIRGGDLVERTRTDWTAWLDEEAAREAKRAEPVAAPAAESAVIDEPTADDTTKPEARINN